MKVKILLASVTIITLLAGAFFLIYFWHPNRPPKTFEESMNIIEQHKSYFEVNQAQGAIFRMGDKIVPRLLKQLDQTKDPFTKKTIYNLISCLSADTYSSIVINACHTNTEELVFILDAPVIEGLVQLPVEKYSLLTNTIIQTYKNETNSEVRLIISNFTLMIENRARHPVSVFPDFNQATNVEVYHNLW